MIQIKIFSAPSTDNLEASVNDFIRGKERTNDRSMMKFSYVDLKYSQVDKVTYDRDGQYFWINEPGGGVQMLGELRGWGAIQNMFRSIERAARPEQTITVPYQCCPKCNGQGTVSKPPHLAGDVYEWSGTAVQHQCNVCNGAMIIPQMIIPKQNDKD